MSKGLVLLAARLVEAEQQCALALVKAQQDLKVKVARAEQERDEWKVRCPTSTTICALLMVITVQIHVTADDAQYNNDVVTA